MQKLSRELEDIVNWSRITRGKMDTQENREGIGFGRENRDYGILDTGKEYETKSSHK